MECVIGDNSSERASEFLRIVMLFVNQAVVQPCADIVQPSMRSIDEESRVLAVFLMTELLLKALEGQNISGDLWDALTRFKLAGSRHVVKRKRHNVLHDDFDYGHKFAMYGLHILQYDNLREAKDYLPLAGDYQEVHRRTRGYIVMMLKAAPDLPTATELEGLRPNYVLDSEIPKWLPFHLRAAPTTGARVEALSVDLEVSLDPDEKELADDQYAANHVKPDNVLFRDLNSTDTVVVISQYNMGVVQTSVSAGAALDVALDNNLQDALFAATMTVQDGWVFDEQGRKISPIHMHTGALSIGDGSPAYSILRGIDQGTLPRIQPPPQVPGGPDQPALYNSPGGFHMYLEMWKMWGGLFKDSHLTILVKTWRPTQGRLDWLLNPGDPRQTEDETEEYLLANYLTAARACADELGTQGEEQVTAQQVEEYMQKRACEHAAVFDLNLGLQWANVIFMMRDSEGSGDRGNLALFQSAQRIATLLFALSHATKYVRICTEERYHWAHASEAEHLIHELYVFTKKTRHGCSIFGDRMMEWFVRDIRSIVGKFWGAGKANQIAETVRSLPELLKQGRSIKTEDQRAAASSGQPSSSARQESQRAQVISETFKAAMIALKKHNVWGPGPPLNKAGADLAATNCLADEPINIAYLRMMPLADARVTAYAAAYNVEGAPLLHAVERAEDTPSLARVASLQSSINDDAKHEWRRWVETDPDMLEGRTDFLRGRKRLVTAKECIAELDLPETRALFTVPPDSLVPPLNTLRNTLNKRQLSELLSEARRRKHEAQGGSEPEPEPQAPEQAAVAVQQLLAGIFDSHPFTSPTRAGGVAEADYNTIFDIRRSETLAAEPENLFDKELRLRYAGQESQSQPFSMGSAENCMGVGPLADAGFPFHIPVAVGPGSDSSPRAGSSNSEAEEMDVAP
ncbi:hypothetical protein B484DRAFT_400204 [Ochromonadaceae sp. CCMP2298]|nr:hypothetical protein B484DRAFT_400204 [Ochromonadaceae sp. CCMP2298]